MRLPIDVAPHQRAMPTEHRLIASLVLLGALACVAAGSWHDPPPAWLVIVATSIVGPGLCTQWADQTLVF